MEENTRKIILMTHGKVGQEMIQGLGMIVGITDEVYAFSLEPGQTVEGYLKEVSSLLADTSPAPLLLVDLFGGTPSNCAGALSARYNVEIVSGVNMPMLIEAVQIRDTYSGEELRQQLIEAGRSGVLDISELIKAT